MQKYNIVKPEKYTDKQGQEKTMWHNVGTITEFSKQDGSISRIVEIPAIGLKCNAFLQEPKPAGLLKPPVRQAEPAQNEIPVIEDNGEINMNQIPF